MIRSDATLVLTPSVDGFWTRSKLLSLQLWIRMFLFFSESSPRSCPLGFTAGFKGGPRWMGNIHKLSNNTSSAIFELTQQEFTAGRWVGLMADMKAMRGCWRRGRKAYLDNTQYCTEMPRVSATCTPAYALWLTNRPGRFTATHFWPLAVEKNTTNSK